MPGSERILVIDPGSSKSGIGVFESPGTCLYKSRVGTDSIIECVREMVQNYGPSTLVIGNGTTSSALVSRLKQSSLNVPIELIDESYSTEQARALWRAETPARGVRRLIPRSLWLPDEPLDAYVTQILASRYFQSQSNS
jgi:RNase H-fold protein (predicted Holliday junction resolvase)